MNVRRFAPIAVALVTFACSQDPQPSRSDIEQAVTGRLPALARVSSLSVEATQNMGTKVEPLWQARFRATVKVASTTFASDGADAGVAFVRVVKRDGESIELFGKSASTLYAGTWRTSVEFEGRPIEGLGLPESAFGPGKVIVRGSKEEAAYASEQAEKQRLATIAAQRDAEAQRVAQERANEERRKMLAEAPRLLVGVWRFDSSLVTFGADGTKTDKYDTGQTTKEQWSVDGDIVTATVIEIIGNMAGVVADRRPHRLQILELTRERLVFKEVGGLGREVHAARVK